MKTCKAKSCNRKHYSKGLCSMHYLRLKRKTKPENYMDRTLKERFNDKYNPAPKTDCWLWTGSVVEVGCEKRGYGRMRLNGHHELAHRISWTLHKGPIPEGLFVLHKCDMPKCVNPDHLWLGTQKDNMQDSVKKGRLKGRTTRWDKKKGE